MAALFDGHNGLEGWLQLLDPLTLRPWDRLCLYANTTFAGSPMRLPQSAHGVGEMMKNGGPAYQLGLEPGSKSKIADGYATRKARPRGVAVADF